jgi:putative ABC transport system permease protein
VASHRRLAIQTIRDVVAKADPQIPVASFRTLDEVRGGTRLRQRVHALLPALMEGLAFLLSGIGLYGLSAHSVAERTRVLGIPIALGAATGKVLRSVIGPGWRSRSAESSAAAFSPALKVLLDSASVLHQD